MTDKSDYCFVGALHSVHEWSFRDSLLKRRLSSFISKVSIMCKSVLIT